MLRRSLSTLVLAASLAACGAPPSSEADSDSDPTTTGDGDPSGDGDPTTTGDGDPSGDGDPTTTGDGDPTGDGDGLSCPLRDQPGVALRSPTLSLFADGDDPSASPSCAVVNPERGFHGYVDLRTLDAGTLDDIAAAGLSVVYGQVLLPEYRDSPLDAQVLDEIAAGFALVRSHAMSVVPRFHYSDAIDEPDADLEQILDHIEQLTPILAANADVILTLQAGFIGAWGEWHSSQNGLDAPDPRKQILDALLAALPSSRTVSVRRPSFKQDAYAGPLDSATAYGGSPLARVGHVNDCFLASPDDAGTYQVMGEKDYAIQDSAWVPVGGETCAVNPPRSECASALTELALHHWTHLNSAYHPGVLASWQDEGCYGQIACRLGYRLAVTELRWAETATAGATLPVSFSVFNDGFAAPVNARPVLLVLDGPVRIELELDGVDPRTWLAGEAIEVCVDAGLPSDLPAGVYTLGLRLPDASVSLRGDGRRAIQLVGGQWDTAAGVNWLDAAVTIAR